MPRKSHEQQNALYGTWWRVPEEDTPGAAVYRREGSPLPPARGRRGFTLEKEGRATLHGPSATDRRESTEGHWHVDADGRLHIDGVASVPTSITHVGKDKLILKE
jgi:hypothetical protein